MDKWTKFLPINFIGISPNSVLGTERLNVSRKIESICSTFCQYWQLDDDRTFIHSFKRCSQITADDDLCMYEKKMFYILRGYYGPIVTS